MPFNRQFLFKYNNLEALYTQMEECHQTYNTIEKYDKTDINEK